MRRILTLTLAVFILALQPSSAQNNKEQGEYKYFKADVLKIINVNSKLLVRQYHVLDGNTRVKSNELD